MKLQILMSALMCFYLVNCRSTINSVPKECLWSGNNLDIFSCQLRTISQAESLLKLLRTDDLRRIEILKLQCSDVLFFESTFESASFIKTLVNLKGLEIENCKIKYIPAMVLSSLIQLNSLVIRTHNTDWSAMNLELHPESFRGLMELKDINLSENNIWTLPNNVFCPMYSLRNLNLTGNRLNDIAQLGFNPESPEDVCNTGLEVLDLSYNDITFLADNGISGLRSLKELYLQDNLITLIGDQSFNGLQSLEVLNISSNRAIAIPPELFKTTRMLRKIYIRNNSLSVLAPGLFEGLNKLEILDLSNNQLTSSWVHRTTFDGLVRLAYLNLGYNELTKIDLFMLHGLYSLQILNLENNLIDFIDPRAMIDLKNLISLNLSNNKLKVIEEKQFSDLFVLNQLFLESNQLNDIHYMAFENLTNLNDLSLNDNKLTQIPNGLNKLTDLKSLDLGKNKIIDLNGELFEGLNNLMGLRLVDNFIKNITNESFNQLPNLQVLNLESNLIENIDESSFKLNTNLRAIKLDNNRIKEISMNLFSNLQSLVLLNVSDNKINQFDYSYFPKSLEWLDAHKNNITRLDDFMRKKNTLKLKMLDVSFNNLLMIDDSTIPDGIEVLFLNNNKIKTVSGGTFLRKRFIEKVVLYGNLITNLEISSLALFTVDPSRKIPEFFMGNNPIDCDCNMEWLRRINELSHFRQHPQVPDLDMITCQITHNRGDYSKSIVEMTSEEFVCKYESHCFALCHCCDYDACDCKMTCPDGCSCYHDPAWKTNVVDCGVRNFTEIPEKIPMDVTVLYLDGNNFNHLDKHLFIGKKKLEKLYLNSSFIRSFDKKAFTGLTTLTEIHLKNNLLKQIPTNGFSQMTSLKEIYLNENFISKIDDYTFSDLKNLEILNLEKNNLLDFKPWEQLPYKKSNIQLNLDDNKWNCDCDSLKKFSEYANFDKLICTNNITFSLFLKKCQIKVNIKEIEPEIQRTILISEEINYMPIFITILSIIVVILLLTILICIYHKTIKLWFYSKYGIRTGFTSNQNNRKNEEKLYDCYMISSVQDTDFTYHKIVSEMEQQKNLSVCLHHRDICSNEFITDSIQCTFDASKKIVIVLSINFLQLEYSNLNFREGLRCSIENIHPSLRREKVVFILLSNKNVLMIDPIIENWMKTCTIIQWDDKKFFEKLNYSMPDVDPTKLINQPNLRYTPAPTTMDYWYATNNYPGTAHQIYPINLDSAYNTEEDSSAYSQYSHLPYVSRESLGHVYSTIPEVPVNNQPNNKEPCFV